MTTSVILGQLDAFPGPPRAPMGGLEKQPWMHWHGDVIKNTVTAVDGADLIKFCFSMGKKDNAKELGCHREGWQSEWIKPKLHWCGLLVSGIGGAISLFNIFGWFSRVWGFASLPFITLGISVVNLYVGFWVLDTDDPCVNFLCCIGWGIVGLSWPARGEVTCLAQTASPSLVSMVLSYVKRFA